MDWPTYILLSVMMFLQFAAWGAWSPVLAARLLGPLKFSGKQTGWIYGTIYIGFVISPLIAGQLVDRWLATQWFLAGANLVGGVLLLVAARRREFRGLFVVMCLYALAFAPTVGLGTALMFRHLATAGVQSFAVFIWGVVAWVLAGWGLALWRRAKGSGEGADCLVLAGVLSLILGVFCFFLPDTPPKGAGATLLDALGLLKDPNFLVFLVVGMALATQLQFYFLGTAQYLGHLGVKARNVPAAMSIAQAAQVGAMLFMAFYERRVLASLGFRWTLAIGILSWLAMYGAFSAGKPKIMVVASQALHGIAYALFINVGFVYVNTVAPKAMAGSANGLYTFALFGIGFFVGTQFTGAVMDRLRTPDGQFRWQAIYLVPCAVTLASAVALVALFRG